MKCNTEIKPSLKYTSDDGVQAFIEGDDIICCLRNGKRYIGKIECIGNYQENGDSEPEQAIYIDTSKSETSYSGELVKVADITYICKNPVNDIISYPKINEEQDKCTFMKILAGLGYAKERAGSTYDRIKDIINLYNIPLSSTLASVIQEINLSTEGKSQEEFMDIINKCMDTIVRIFQTITDTLEGKMKSETNVDSQN